MDYPIGIQNEITKTDVVAHGLGCLILQASYHFRVVAIKEPGIKKGMEKPIKDRMENY